MKKIKIQMIGSYYVNQLTNRLSGDIIVQNVVSGLSPFTITGTPDNSLIQELENKLKDLSQYSEKPSSALYEKQSRCLFDLKKNFSELLSRDENIYCDNIIFQGFGKDIIKCNGAKYIIIDNTSAIYPVIKYNNVLYTDNWSVNPLIDFLKLHNGARFSPSRLEDFNWQYYFDKYIDAILECYDSNRIILIKTSMNDLYFDSEKRSPMFFPETDTITAKFIQNLDQYFAEKTGCIVVDLLCGRIPNKLEQSGWRYSGSMGKAYNEVADEINRIILENNTNTVENKTSVHYNSPLAKSIYEKVYEPYIGDFSEILKVAESYRASSFERITDKIEKNEEITYLFSLEQFLKKNGYKNLCDYIKSCFNQNYTALDSSPDFLLIRNYSRFFECDINDILSIYYLYNFCDDKSLFSEISEIAQNIILQEKCPIIKHNSDFIEKNVRFLKNYQNINQKYVSSFIEPEKKYVRICDNGWIIIDSHADRPFKLVLDLIKNNIDFADVISNGCVCTVDYADALTYSYDYYIEKAKKGLGAEPTYIKFETQQDFNESLEYIDYVGLLSNERFIIIIGDDEYKRPENFVPIVDFTELVDPNTVTVNIRGGLNDQIKYYLSGQMIEKYSGRKVLYDDTSCMEFNGLEVNKLAVKNIELLSSRLSERLTPNKNAGYLPTFKNLFAKISDKCTVLTDSYEKRYLGFAKGYSCYILGRSLKNLFTANLPYSHYYSNIAITELKKHFDIDLKEYIQFPPFCSQKNIELSEKILSCDSVIIHIRRGDFVSLGWETDNKYYRDAIQKVLEMTEYKNKKFFIFSNDIEWCKNNREEIGLNQVENFEIIFVEGNSEDESFRDMQLMALGKIMIICESGFSKFASFYNDYCEVFISPSRWYVEYYNKYIRKSKYTFDLLGREYQSTYLKSDIPKQNKNNGSSAENVIVQNNAGGDIIGRECIEWLNFWFDDANNTRNDRVLLIGDSVSRQYRGELGRISEMPIDFFATSASITEDIFWKQLDHFFSYEEYRQKKAHIQIGFHGIVNSTGYNRKAAEFSYEEYEKSFEKLVQTVMKYVPVVVVALTTPVVKQSDLSVLDEYINGEIIKRNNIAEKVAKKYNLKINNLYSLMLDDEHVDRVHFTKAGNDKLADAVAHALELK